MNTDFSRWPHAELIRALSAANPYVMRAAADTWAVIAASLHALAQDIVPADSSWSGPAADRHRQMTGALAGGATTVAGAAAEIRDLTYAASEALHTAWTTMPPVGGAAAHRQAVLVMATLAERYTTIATALRAALSRLPADPAAPETDPVTGAPVTGRAPLFGGLMPAGLAATAAAAARTLPVVRPGAATPSRVAGSAAVPPSGLSGGGLGGGGAARLPALTPPPASAAVSSAAALAPGVAAATGGAAASAGRGFTPPMMAPGMMGGMADGGGAGGRRIPPWLVETQDVWGESSPVTSAVIGEGEI